jgi:sugar phosphate isomerase/epimerase
MIALSTGSLHTYGTVRVARLAAAAGFDALEVIVDARWDTRDPGYLRDVARSVALPIVSFHAPFVPGIDGWSADEFGRLTRTVDLARAVGARTVVVHPPLRYRWLSVRYPPFVSLSALVPFPRWRSPFRDWLRHDLQAFQASSGITIAVENMPRHRFLGPWKPNLFDLNHLRDLRHFPAVTLDTTHLGTWNVDLLDVYELLADRVVHVHLSNYDGRQHRLPQDGRLPLGRFLGELRRRRFGGVIVVELVPESLGAGDDRTVEERLAGARAFCRDHFG